MNGKHIVEAAVTIANSKGLRLHDSNLINAIEQMTEEDLRRIAEASFKTFSGVASFEVDDENPVD